MNDEASQLLAGVEGKKLDEVAQTYVFGVLEVDVPEDVQTLWAKSFDNRDQAREAEQALHLLDANERETLLLLAMQAGVEDRPETDQLLSDSVAQAGQSLFILEASALALAAALLLREWHKKGRATETKRKIVVDGDRVVIDEQTTTFESSGGLAKALAKLGLGSSA